MSSYSADVENGLNAFNWKESHYRAHILRIIHSLFLSFSSNLVTIGRQDTSGWDKAVMYICKLSMYRCFAFAIFMSFNDFSDGTIRYDSCIV